jgi:hypothetical protein
LKWYTREDNCYIVKLSALKTRKIPAKVEIVHLLGRFGNLGHYVEYAIEMMPKRECVGISCPLIYFECLAMRSTSPGETFEEIIILGAKIFYWCDQDFPCW